MAISIGLCGFRALGPGGVPQLILLLVFRDLLKPKAEALRISSYLISSPFLLLWGAMVE